MLYFIPNRRAGTQCSSRFANTDSRRLTFLSSPAKPEGLVCRRKTQPQHVASRGQSPGPPRMLSTGRAQGAVSPLGCLTGVFSHGQAVQGTGLSFIVYTEAIKNMAASQLWSVLYFFMLLMLGIGSMLGNTAAILTPLTDSKVISSHLPKEAISGEWANPRRTWGSGRAGRGARADGQAAAGPCAGGGGDLLAVLPWLSPPLGQWGPGTCASHPRIWFSLTRQRSGRPSAGKGRTHRPGAVPTAVLTNVYIS